VNTNLEEGFIARPANEADFPAAVEVFNAYAEAAGSRPTSLSYLCRPLKMAGFDMQNDTRVVISPEGRIAAFAIMENMSMPPVYPSMRGGVHPDFEKRGIGTYLLTWAENRAIQYLKEIPAGIRAGLRCYCSIRYQPAIKLFKDGGFKEIRQFRNMRIDLANASPRPQWPENITLTTFKDHPDLRAVYRTIDEAFRDHWGHIAQDEEKGLEQWRRGFLEEDFFDPTLWFLVMEGDELVAAALCSPKSGNDADTGYIMELGVRRQWRKKGIALNLLYQVFNEFRSRGRRYSGLSVDAASLTGATRLYERAGMVTIQTSVLYEKELRTGKDLSTQTIA